MKGMMVNMGVSFSMLREALSKPNKKVANSGKKAKKARVDGDGDISSNIPEGTNESLPLENGNMFPEMKD